MTVYDQLLAIAAAKRAEGYLAHYETDLTTHDARQLAAAAAGDRFVWIMRSHGTELFSIGTGRDPVWATYWLNPAQGNCQKTPSLCYLIAGNTVTPISYDRAVRLANEKAPAGTPATHAWSL
jgi:hypothetical protein